MGVLTVQNIWDRVKRQFGDEAGIMITSAFIIDWINDGMREIILENDLLKQRSTSNTVINQANYGLPTDMLRFHSLSYDGEPLVEVSLQEARRTIPNIDNSTLYAKGIPQNFYVYGTEFFLFPAPNAVKTLTVYYNKNPSLVTAVGDTPVLPARYDNRLVEYCLAQAAELDDDPEQSARKLAQFQEGLEKARDEDNSSGMFPHMGVPLADTYSYTYLDY